MKKYLLWAVSGAVLFSLFAWMFGAFHCDKVPRTISVNGECLTTAPKDKIAITMRVTTLNKSAAESMKSATTKVAAITEYLKTKDVQMQTTEFNSYEKTEWNHESQKSVSLGIETVISVEVSAKSIDEIESVMTQFAGGSNIFFENLRMYTSNETLKPIMEKCLETAVENARERATALANGAGGRVGKMLSVSYGASSAMQPVAPGLLRASAKMVMADAAMNSVAGSLVSKDTDVSVAVSAVFEIK